MCGEHRVGLECVFLEEGSSPHVRGALRLFRFPLDLTGIIPACAGSTIRLAGRSMCSRDHPRMCGEHQRGVRDPRTALGSSPHVRGARLERDENPSRSGIIPACAGSTDRVGAAGSLVGDHPRMCGEHITPNPFANAVLGSSPHVRGALIQGIVLHCPLGIIPACAGSTASAATASDPRRDHPRMCGEHLVDGDRNRLGRGSSPHVRGAQDKRKHGIILGGIIPACAGSTSYLAAIFHLPRDHPRMCGEHRNIIACICVSLGSSPHVRGAQKHCRHRRGVPGIIPACAGSTSTPTTRNPTQWDHPRMCGEHSSAASPPSLD